MLTLQVYGKRVTWPDEFANLMIEQYQKRGIPFVVQLDLDASPQAPESRWIELKADAV